MPCDAQAPEVRASQSPNARIAHFGLMIYGVAFCYRETYPELWTDVGKSCSASTSIIPPTCYGARVLLPMARGSEPVRLISIPVN